METIVSEVWPDWTGTLDKRSGGWNNIFFSSDLTRVVCIGTPRGLN